MKRGRLIILLSVFALISLFSILAVYYTHQLPTEKTRTTALYAYKHVGNYTYIAKLKPNIIYNQSTLKPGEGPLYTAITEYINTTFTYTFESSQEANITIEYIINVYLETTKWSKNFHTFPQNTVNSMGTIAQFSNNYPINLTSVQQLKEDIEAESGARVSEYNVTIKPEIHTIANNNIGTIDEYFTPTMTMAFKYGTPEGNYISTAGLEHTTPGAITQTETIYQQWVINQRYASYAISLPALTGLAYITWAFIKTKPTKPEKPLEKIIAPYEEAIAESTGEPTYKGQRATVTMKTIDDLIKVADWIDKPILSYQKTPSSSSKETTRIFYVLDGPTRYECTITARAINKEEGED